MLRRRPVPDALLALSLVVLAAGCSASRVSSKRPAAPVPPTVAAVRRSARLLGDPPPVRVFAGVQSDLAALRQFCRGSGCQAAGGAVPRIGAAAGSVVTFAVDPAPDQAVLDVSGDGGGRVALATGTLMAYPKRPRQGGHRLTLQLRWGSVSGTWVLDLVVAPGS